MDSSDRERIQESHDELHKMVNVKNSAEIIQYTQYNHINIYVYKLNTLVLICLLLLVKRG